MWLAFVACTVSLYWTVLGLESWVPLFNLTTTSEKLCT